MFFFSKLSLFRIGISDIGLNFLIKTLNLISVDRINVIGKNL